MKKLAILFASVLMAASSVQVFAQENLDPECIKYLSYYKEYYKQKSYEQALPSWRQAFKLCPPNTRETVYTEGAAIYRYMINKNRNNAVAKEAYVDTLLLLHDMRAQYYPKNAVTSLNNKGLDMVNYVQDDNKALYKDLGAIIANNGEQTKPQIFLFNLNAAVALFKDGVIDAEEVINTYENSMSILENIVAKDASESNTKVKSDVENIFISSHVADCDNLLALFGPRYDADPENVDLATKIVKMMGTTEGCTSNDLFLNAVNVMHSKNPSYLSAYNLFKLYSSRGDYNKAVSFAEEAIAYEESDEKVDAQYNYELAAYAIKSGKTAKAFEAATKAAELDPSLAAKAYMICATAWGATNCGGDDMARRAPYWVAVDYLNKAKAADASLADEANSLISQYAKYYPQTADAFMYGYQDGQSYTVACNGMRATTTVRTQK
ncbi:MAG: hypothetical protein KBT05_04180 [Bacteroidales bacterium]|nr:hypothetical protein [Candidatus Cryptobacteroides caccocaballi]